LIDKPILVSLGLNDMICHSKSVRKLFDKIKSIKLLLEITKMGHERSTVWRYLTQKWFDFYL